MNERPAQVSEPGSAVSAAAARPALLLHVAWLAIAVGISLQILVLVAGTIAGGAAPATVQLVADTAQKTSWSVLVCGALAVGATVSRGSAALTGLAGLLGAPAAFIVARAVQKGVNQALTQ
jgi:hypothetical protein